MEVSTRQRILEEALSSFANNGYKGTNLRDLANNLGLTKSALYRHFKSKEDIWNAVINMMQTYYTNQTLKASKNRKPIMSCDELFAMTMNMVNFTINDPKVILTRKILYVEQFNDKRVSEFATIYFYEGTKAMYTKVFENMMETGILKKGNPEMLAFIYTTPITSLIHLSDREPDRKEEAIEKIDAFIKHFIKMYSN